MNVAQAEALATALGDIVLGSAATKSDLTEPGSSLRDEIKGVELRLTMRMGVITASSAALTVAILGVLITLS